MIDVLFLKLSANSISIFLSSKNKNNIFLITSGNFLIVNRKLYLEWSSVCDDFSAFKIIKL
jgi:hypothetical protein